MHHEILDNPSREDLENWVFVQFTEWKLSPIEVMEKLKKRKGVSSTEAYSIVQCIYRKIRKKAILVQSCIGLVLLVTGPFCFYFSITLGVICIGYGLLKTGSAIVGTIELRREYHGFD